MSQALILYLKVFLVGGFICMLGQILVIRTKITTARILVVFLLIGSVLGAVGVYSYIVAFAGAGATVPITGFGHALAKGAILGARSEGFYGALAGGLIGIACGIAASIAVAYVVALIFQSRTKKN